MRGFLALILVALLSACTATAPVTAHSPKRVSHQFVATHAKAHGIPAKFALAVVKVESGFKPRVRGKAGEYGLMQIKCSTARGIGFRGKCSSLLDAATNARWGMKYLGMALKRAKGDQCRAAALYNAGIHARRIPKAAWKYCSMVKSARRHF